MQIVPSLTSSLVLTIVWKRHAGSWLSRLPLTKSWKIAGTFSQEHCSNVPQRHTRANVPLLEMKWDNANENQGSLTFFPCQKKNEEGPGKFGSRSFTSFQMVHTHTQIYYDNIYICIYIYLGWRLGVPRKTIAFYLYRYGKCWFYSVFYSVLCSSLKLFDQ